MGGAIANLYAEVDLRTNGLEQGLKNVKTGLTGFIGKVDGAVKATTGLSLASIGWAAVLGKAVQMVGKAVNGFVEYSNQIQDISRLTGASAEDMSRLVQVGDDVRLTYDQIKTSMQIASRQGIDVSIDGIKRLSDQYLALNPGVDRAQFLLKTFGRSGADMGRLLEMGSAGIDKATASVESGLIMDQKAIAKAEALRLAKDALGDSVTALGNKMASGLIPIITDLINGFVGAIGAGERFFEWLKSGRTAEIQHEQSTRDLTKTYKDYKAEMDASAARVGKSIDENGNLIITYTREGVAVREVVQAHYALTEAQYDLSRQQAGLNGMVEEGVQYFGDIRQVLQQIKQAKYDAQIANIADAVDDLNFQLSGQFTKANDNYNASLKDLTGKLDDLTGQIGELEGKKYLTAAQKEELEKLRGEYDDTKTAIQELGAEHTKQYRQMIVENLMARASAMPDGDEKEAAIKSIQEIAQAWGLIGQAELDVQAKTDWFFENLNNKDLSKIIGNVDLLKQTILGLPANTNLDIWINEYRREFNAEQNRGDHRYGGEVGFAAGGDPPANRPSWVGERGPELFMPGMQGHIVSNADILAALRQAGGNNGGGGNTYNLTINAGNVNQESVIYGYRTLQLMQEG